MMTMKMIKIEYLSEMDAQFDTRQSEQPRYFAPKDMKLELGDIVVVERYNQSITVGQVTNIHEDNNRVSNYTHSFKVLDVVTDSCTTFQNKYNEVAKHRIKKQIDQRAREIDKMIEYEKYAKYDDQFKALFEDYKAKGGFDD